SRTNTKRGAQPALLPTLRERSSAERKACSRNGSFWSTRASQSAAGSSVTPSTTVVDRATSGSLPVHAPHGAVASAPVQNRAVIDHLRRWLQHLGTAGVV